MIFLPIWLLPPVEQGEFDVSVPALRRVIKGVVVNRGQKGGQALLVQWLVLGLDADPEHGLVSLKHI